jgi:hypothetical protein
MLGIEHEPELLDNCRKQLDIFKKIGGRFLKWEELSTRLSTSEFAPDLVLDAMFGIHISFNDLRTDDQATAYEMISWVNRSNLDVLSVDVPSGLSAMTGKNLRALTPIRHRSDLLTMNFRGGNIGRGWATAHKHNSRGLSWSTKVRTGQCADCRGGILMEPLCGRHRNPPDHLAKIRYPPAAWN